MQRCLETKTCWGPVWWHQLYRQDQVTEVVKLLRNIPCVICRQHALELWTTIQNEPLATLTHKILLLELKVCNKVNKPCSAKLVYDVARLEAVFASLQ